MNVLILCRAAATMDQEAVALWKSVLQRLNSTDITSITGRGNNMSVATLQLSDEINKLTAFGSLSTSAWKAIITEMEVCPEPPVGISRPCGVEETAAYSSSETQHICV